MSNSRRQVDEGSDAEDDVPIVEDTARFQARNDQAEIMMVRRPQAEGTLADLK